MTGSQKYYYMHRWKICLLHAQNVHKSFGGLRALDGATVQLRAGKINLLIGANGSGKSTLINTMSGLYDADQGSFMMGVKDITDLQMHERFEEGLMRTFQNPRLFGSLTVLDNLLLASKSSGYRFGRAMLGGYDSDEATLIRKARQILEDLEISHLEQSMAYEISGGQIKLLELGKTMMTGASTVLLDEPIAGIAPKLAHKIFDKIVNICVTRHITFCIVEHRLDIALKYADWVFVMSEGRIIAQDTPKKILDNPVVIESYLK